METNDYFYCKTKKMKKLVFGVLIVLAGLLLLGFNTGLLNEDYKHIIFSWQMLLIGIGIINIVGKDNWTAGLILISIGTYFLLPHFFDFEVRKVFLPILIIFIGLVILSKYFFKKDSYVSKWANSRSNDTFEAGYIFEKNIFGGGKRSFQHGEFKGGKIECIFGGGEIDLTQATLAEGNNVLELNLIFGGVTLLVPGDWVIYNEVSGILGGFNDNRKNIISSDTKKVLYLKGSAIFGGGEIKSR
ncbi:MAG: hypothetical protein A2046_13105 [Bacteroidetes bacterium GWA2_30_7]|nr:MAG: hypothetical protein A2046_13105 [Bacteroidetes bacterium GWA2_30_7]